MLFKKINTFIFFVAFIFIFPIFSQAHQEAGAIIQDEYIVGFKERGLNAQSLSPAFFPLFEKTEVKEVAGDQLVLLKTNNTEVIDQIERLKEVEFVERNRVIKNHNYKQEALTLPEQKKVKVPNDRYWSHQWGLMNITSGIDILEAWGLSTGSKDVVVAILDSGMEVDHEDLKENVWVNKKEKNGKPGIDDDGNGYVDDIYGYDFLKDRGKMEDEDGHGTLVAGVVGAKVNNKIGIAGVNWDVSLMSLRFLDKDGYGGLFNAARGIIYAANNGAHVINASFSAQFKSRSIEKAIEKAQKKGVILVAAAGNDNDNIDKDPIYPAALSLKYDNVITVGATTKRGRQWRFSNYGKKTVQLFAPGHRIYSTYKNNKYRQVDGTSLAAPYVSGVAALILAKNPRWTYKQVISKILKSVKKQDKLKSTSQTSGVLNAHNALKP